MITLILLFFPILATVLLILLGDKYAKKIALGASVIEFGIALFAVSKFVPENGIQFELNVPWIETLGMTFHVGIDGIAMLLVLLTTFLVPIIIASSFNSSINKKIQSQTAFYALMLLMEMALIGVFVSLDGFLFYVYWELALIPIYFICLLWGGKGVAKITVKFFVYTLAGSLLMLAAFIYLYLNTAGVHSFDMFAMYEAAQGLSMSEQTYIFWAIFLAFAIKMPIFPLHTWQPDTYTVAPANGTMLLSGIMLKMGTFGVLRWLIAMVPMATKEWMDEAITLSVIGILYASSIAIIQKDFKRLVAYASIAHVGLISAGMFSLTEQGIQGAMIQMLSHGVIAVGLFFIIDIIETRTGTRELQKLGGIRNVNPQFAVFFLIVLLGSVGLPLTNGFVGEFLLLVGLYQYSGVVAGFAGVSVILGAVYMLRSYQAVMLGETNSVTAGFGNLHTNEKVVLFILCGVIIVFGIYPQPLLDISAPAVHQLIEMLKVS